jgi:adsorption protein B
MLEFEIRIIGLIVALCYIIFSFDDIIWDIVCFIGKIRVDPKTKRVPLESLEAIPPKLLAVIVAAWNEDNVLEPVIDNNRYITHSLCIMFSWAYTQMMMRP